MLMDKDFMADGGVCAKHAEFEFDFFPDKNRCWDLKWNIRAGSVRMKGEQERVVRF